MIIFDIINSLFKCWFRFKYFYLNSAVHTKWIKIIVKGCSNFRNKELWWKFDWYFIDNFSIFWEALCFWADSNQLLFDIFLLLMLLFGNLIIFIKLGLEFGIKAIFRRSIFIIESKHLIFNVLWWELVWFHLFF